MDTKELLLEGCFAKKVGNSQAGKKKYGFVDGSESNF